MLAEINGRPYIVSFDVEVFSNVNNYRTYRINKIELFSATDVDTGRDPAAGGQETAPVEARPPVHLLLLSYHPMCRAAISPLN